MIAINCIHSDEHIISSYPLTWLQFFLRNVPFPTVTFPTNQMHRRIILQRTYQILFNRQHESPHPLREEWRNLIVIAQVLSHSVKSVNIKNQLTFSFARLPFSALSVKLLRISRLIFVFSQPLSLPSRRHQRHILWDCLRTPTCARSMQNV